MCNMVSAATGIPVEKLGKSDREKLLALEDRMRERVIGQPDAVKAIAEAVQAQNLKKLMREYIYWTKSLYTY